MSSGDRVQDGDLIDYVTTGAVTAKDVKAAGTGLVCVVLQTATTGATVPAATRGVYEITVATGVAIAQGDLVFWNAASGTATETATDIPAGICWAAKAAGAGLNTVKVRLNESAAGGI